MSIDWLALQADDLNRLRCTAFSSAGTIRAGTCAQESDDMIDRPDEFIRKMNCYGTLRRLQMESVTQRYRVSLLQHRIRPMLASIGDLHRWRTFVSRLTYVKPWRSDGREDVVPLFPLYEQLTCLTRTLKAILDQSNGSTRLLRSAIALLNQPHAEGATWAETDDMAMAIEISFRGSSHLLTRLERAVEKIDLSVRLTRELD